jgi:hypothetical protein
MWEGEDPTRADTSSSLLTKPIEMANTILYPPAAHALLLFLFFLFFSGRDMLFFLLVKSLSDDDKRNVLKSIYLIRIYSFPPFYFIYFCHSFFETIAGFEQTSKKRNVNG